MDETCGSEPARDSGVQFASMLYVLPPSRAGSLPQGLCLASCI
ncbi:hypothetical protein [Pseudomonas sp. FG-3G]|nr:hypothetical protein [Pseudomonas sp. FG-3G]